MKFIICKGLPGSGKSTWAQSEAESSEVLRVNRDDLRVLLHGKAKWSKAREKKTVLIRNAMIRAGLAAGMTVISDDTNLDPNVERELRLIAGEFKAQVEIKSFLDVPVKTCIERDAARDRTVGREVIIGMYDRYIRPTPEPQDPSLPPCIIVDMDGTLATIKGRSPYEDHLCEQDDLNEAVSDMVRGYLLANPDVRFIIMSGRDEGRARVATSNWLGRHALVPDALYMRPAGNTDHDNIIKRDLYDEHIRGKFFVKFVVDDRDQVVELWRKDLGLPTFQCAYGNF